MSRKRTAKQIPILAFKNHSDIEAAKQCGCFYCLNIFPSNEIREWVDDHQTALCPRCSVDSVVPESPEVTLTPELLKEVHEDRFGKIERQS